MTTSSIDALLEQAKDLDTGQVRALRAQLVAAAGALAEQIGRESARAKIVTLEAQLAHAYAVAYPQTGSRPSPTPVTQAQRQALAAKASRTVDYPPKVVRDWAAAAGLKVPASGRFLPADVVQAWRDAGAPGSSEQGDGQ